MRPNSRYYDEIRGYLDSVPVIDTHEHSRGLTSPPSNPIGYIASNYYESDLQSAAYGFESELLEALSDSDMPFEERYAAFERAYVRSRHTAYARAVRIDLRECWGIEEISRESLKELDEKMKSSDGRFYEDLMKRALMTVPHSKIMAFGGDIFRIEWTVGYLTMARDSVACALSEMVDCGWMGIDEAKQVAADWLFNNPNELFRLGFERFEP